MKEKGPWEKGWQFSWMTGRPGVAARTWASMHDERVTRARFIRLRLFHAGMMSLKIAGSSLSLGAYQARPKPSPLRGSSPSRLLKLWLIIELTGSVTRELIVILSPRYTTKRQISISFFI
jgi:hypothetical protein